MHAVMHAPRNPGELTMCRTRLLLVGFLLIGLILLMSGVSERAAAQFK